jgi:hypothetical protein
MPPEPALVVVIHLFNEEASSTPLFEKITATADKYTLGIYLKTS